MSGAHDKFARLCREFNLNEVHREESPFGAILVGEAFKNATSEHNQSAWCVLWYVRRGGKDDVARRIYFDLGSGSTREGRLNAALADARQFVRDAAHVGYFDR